MCKWASDAKTIRIRVEQPESTLICVNSRSLVGDDHLAAPAQPESTDGFNKVLGASVAIRSCDLLTAKVRHRRGARRRDRVPRDAATAYDIERLETPGEIVWLIVGCRCGGDQPNPLRFAGNHSEHQRRFEPIERRLVRNVGIYRGGIGEEYSIQQTVLRKLRSPDVVLDIKKRAWICARPAPRGGMTTSTMKI